MFRQPSNQNAQHNFSEVPRADIPRSTFNRSHTHKTALDAGKLVPVFVDEVVPGDTFNMRATIFARLSTLIDPIMDNQKMDIHFFFVPHRLVWTNFVKFMGEQDNPGDSTSYTVPTFTSTAGTGYTAGTLQDYMGLPIGVPGFTHSALPLRAYNLIYNTWYRDQNIIGDVVVDKDDGPDTVSDYTLLKRAKYHDYFTSCLPWAQKGTEVSVPLGTSAPVLGIGVWGSNQVIGNTAYESVSGQTIANTAYGWGGASTYNQLTIEDATNSSGTAGSGGHIPNIRADLSSATASTINALRLAFQTQKMYERDARGGTRYTEIIRSHFGVVSPDARLQRPEYLGGGSAPVIVNPVAQTAITSGSNALGNLAGIGTSVNAGNGFVKSFTEHGTIIGILSIRSDLTYQQGVNRMWDRSTRLDFYWPSLAHIGEQAVLTKEIYAVGTGGSTDDDVFGYQERYAEMRYKPSQISGVLRSTYSSPLDSWHLAQKFTSAPTLNQTFIEDTPPMSRVKAVTTEPDYIVDMFFDLKCVRPMPVYSVPGLIDHF